MYLYTNSSENHQMTHSRLHPARKQAILRNCYKIEWGKKPLNSKSATAQCAHLTQLAFEAFNSHA